MWRSAAYSGRPPNPVFAVEIIWFFKIRSNDPPHLRARAHTHTHAHTNKTSLVACNPTRATFLFHHTRIIRRRRRRHDVTHTWSGAVVVYSVCVCVCMRCVCFRCCTLLYLVLCSTNRWTGRSCLLCSALWRPAGLKMFTPLWLPSLFTQTHEFIFWINNWRIFRVHFTQKALSPNVQRGALGAFFTFSRGTTKQYFLTVHVLCYSWYTFCLKCKMTPQKCVLSL